MIILVEKRVEREGWLLINIHDHTGSKNLLNGVCARQERFICSGLEKIGFDGLREMDGIYNNNNILDYFRRFFSMH